MKKFALLLTLLLMSFIAACGGTDNAGDTNQNNSGKTEEKSGTAKGTQPKVEIVN